MERPQGLVEVAAGRLDVGDGGAREVVAGRGDKLLRAREVAGVLNISERQVWRLRSTGTIPAIRVGGAVRFRRSDLDRLVRGESLSGEAGTIHG